MSLGAVGSTILRLVLYNRLVKQLGSDRVSARATTGSLAF